MSTRSSVRCAVHFRPRSESSATPSRRTLSTIRASAARSPFGLTFRYFCGHSGAAILRGQDFFRINESLTLDSPAKLDSNRCDSEATWGSFQTECKLSAGATGMARAHAASACVQSDSIKGLAQSIAKPAYHRLLVAEPALRRAVPTLIIAFLITICLGAFVQVVDQSRQKRASVKRDLTAVADLLAERIDHFAAVRQDRAATIGRLQPMLPDLIPAWGLAAGRHVIVTGADQRVLARVPSEAALGDT